MRKIWLSFTLLVSFLLAACAQQTPAPQATSTREATPTSEAASTSAVEPTQTSFEASGPATCTVTSFLPEVDPTQASLFPPISEKDWVEGPADATVTFMEYSDFQ